MSTALRQIIASFGVSFDKEGSLAKGEKAIGSLTSKLAGVATAIAGAFGVSKIVGFTRGLLDQADGINDVADRLGISTTALQEWRHAAKLSGVEAEELEGSFGKLTAQIADAAKGQGNADVFKKLGVGLKDAQGKLRSGEAVFSDVATAIAAIPNETERAGAASALFGRSYARLLPLFKQGPEGIAALRKDFQDLGGGFSPEFIKQAAKVNDDIDRLSVAFKSFAVDALLPLMPDLRALSKELVELFKGGDGESSFMKDAVRGVRSFIEVFNQIRNRPQEFVTDFVTVFGEGGRAVLGVVDMMTGGWDNFGKKFRAIATGLGLPFRVAMEEIRTSARMTVASVIDDFAGMWNSILLDVQTAITKIGVAISQVPGLKGVGTEIVKGGLGLTESLAPTDAKEKEAAASRQRFGAIHDKALAAQEELGTFRGVLAPKQKRAPDAEPEPRGMRAEPEPESPIRKTRVQVPEPTASQRETTEFLGSLRSMFGAGGPAKFDPNTLAQVMSPSSVAVPGPATTITNQDVRATTTINQHFVVPPGTPVEQQREIAKSGAKGAREVFDTKALQAALIPTPG